MATGPTGVVAAASTTMTSSSSVVPRPSSMTTTSGAGATTGDGTEEGSAFLVNRFLICGSIASPVGDDGVPPTPAFSFSEDPLETDASATDADGASSSSSLSLSSTCFRLIRTVLIPLEL